MTKTGLFLTGFMIVSDPGVAAIANLIHHRASLYLHE